MARADALSEEKGHGAIRRWREILRGLMLNLPSLDLCVPPLNEENLPSGKVGASVLGPTLLLQTKELSPQDEVQNRKVLAFLLLILWARYGLGSLLGF